MKENDIKAIIFDMDGLMFDTEKLWLEACIAVAKKWGYEVSEEFIKSCMGKKYEDIKALFKSLLDGLPLEREGKEFDFDEYRRQHIAYMDEAIENRGMPIKEGLIELLQYARENNIKTAMATSGLSSRVEFYLNKANITKSTFNAIICGDMVQNGKPAPDIFIKACEELSISPEEAIVLEDSMNGIIAAYNAQTKPVMVVDCIEPTDEIRNMLFTNPLNSLLEVKRMLILMREREIKKSE